jgi:hypothetical protein
VTALGRRTAIGMAAAAMLATALLSPLATSASAATYTVDDFGDAGATACLPDPNGASCNLRGAVTAARHAGEASAINLLPGTYHLTLAGENGVDDNLHGDLDWVTFGPTDADSELTISGAGPGQTTIQAPGTFYRILEIHSPAAVTVQGINFTGGRSVTEADGVEGGAIFARSSEGPVALRNVRFEDNESREDTPVGDGGAISTQDNNLTIDDAHFVDNSSGGWGGAIAAPTPLGTIGATVNISNSTFERNEALGGGGGAIVNRGDELSSELDTALTVTNSTFDGNTAIGYGGAIDSFGFGTTATNVISSTFTRNLANSDNTGPEGSGALQNGGSAFTVRMRRLSVHFTGRQRIRRGM